MFKLHHKIGKKLLGAIIVLCVLTASSAFGADVLFVVGKIDLRPGDLSIKNHLVTRGHNVIIKEDTQVRTEDALDMDLVFISESARSRKVEKKFSEVAVPVICSEPWLFNKLGMTGQTKKVDFGRKSHQKNIIIVNPDHPLCASCKEEVQVSQKTFYMGWGVPGKNAIPVAALPHDPGKCTIFAYEAGAEMPGLVAPARRVGLFLFRNTANSFTAEGWTLFDSAVDWSIAEPQPILRTDLQTKTTS